MFGCILSVQNIVIVVESAREPLYELALTNHEVKCMFYKMVRDWFNRVKSDYNNFIKSLLTDDIESMNEYMSELTLKVFSYFDTGCTYIRKASENFYHGFVLGLLVDLDDRYIITSNRESGLGRYDVMLEPKEK